MNLVAGVASQNEFGKLVWIHIVIPLRHWLVLHLEQSLVCPGMLAGSMRPPASPLVERTARSLEYDAIKLVAHDTRDR
jgi:hypothetical protein